MTLATPAVGVYLGAISTFVAPTFAKFEVTGAFTWLDVVLTGAADIGVEFIGAAATPEPMPAVEGAFFTVSTIPI